MTPLKNPSTLSPTPSPGLSPGTTRRRFLHTAAGAAGAAGLLGLGGAPRLAAGPQASAPESSESPELLDSQLFRQAVEAGELDRVRAFLDRDPGLMYSRDARGRSVFILAYLAGHPEVAQLFLDRGLETDLVEAAIIPDWDRVEELAEVAPGMVNALHPIGGTAMTAAARFGRGERIWILQGFGGDANANPKGGHGVTPVRAAFEAEDPRAVEVTVVGLLANGGDPNAPQKDGDSVLHAAAASGNDFLVRLVIRKGGDPAARNAGGETPLALAERLGHSEIADLLRRHEELPRDHRSSRFAYDASGAPFEMPPPTGLPQILHNRFVGVSHGNFDAVRQLAESYPGLLFSVSSADEAMIEACAHTGSREIVEYFLDRGAPLALPTCITAGRLDRARQLLREDPDRIRERGPHDFFLGWYPAIGARGMRDGGVEAAQLLVESGLDLGGETDRGRTALHEAARRGHVDLCAFWIEAGAELNARTRDGETPLDHALASEHGAAADLLRDRGGRRGGASQLGAVGLG